MFTVSSTLMWAVLTGQTDGICHIWTLMLCVEVVAQSCVIVTRWSGSGGIQAWSWRLIGFSPVVWHCWFGHLACKNPPRNDLLCVEWDVKPYTPTPKWPIIRGNIIRAVLCCTAYQLCTVINTLVWPVLTTELLGAVGLYIMVSSCVNPLKPSGAKWLHFKASSAILV